MGVWVTSAQRILLAVVAACAVHTAAAASDDTASLAAACAAEAHLPVPGDPIGKRWSEINPGAAVAACRAAHEAAPEDANVAADYGRALLRAGQHRHAQEVLKLVFEMSPQGEHYAERLAPNQAKFSRAMSYLAAQNLPFREQVEGARSSNYRPEPTDEAEASATRESEGSRDEAFFVELLTDAAESGYVPAQIALGKYRIGALGTIDRSDQDLVGAATLFRRAADAGSVEAKHWLAYSYRHGMGAAKDPNEAARLFREAADAGFAPSMAALGILHHDGFGVPEDRAAGDQWLQRAADAGEGYGQFLLARSLEDQGADEAQVESLLERAAENEIAGAQVALADRIASRDGERASQLYKRAADQGHLLGGMLHLSPSTGHRFALAVTQNMQNLLVYSKILSSLPADPNLVFYGYHASKQELDEYTGRITNIVGKMQISIAKKLLAKRTLLGRETGMSLADAKAALVASAEEGDVDAAVTLAYPADDLSEQVVSQSERERWRKWLAELPFEQRQELAKAVMESRGKAQNFALVLGGLDQPALLGDAQKERVQLETLGKFHLYSLAVERAVDLVQSPQFQAMPLAERLNYVSALSQGLQSTCAWRASVSAFVQQARMLKESTECNEQSAIFRATPKQLQTLFESGMPRAGVQLAYLYRAGELGEVDNKQAAVWLQNAIDRCQEVEIERTRARNQGEYDSDPTQAAASRCAVENKVAKVMLAVLYERGEGVPQDLNKAFELYREGALGGRKAASRECATCTMFLGSDVDPVAAAGAVRLYASGAVKQLSQDEVVRLLSAASRYEEPTGQRMLGVLYLQGDLVPRDEAEAARWLLKAALGGDAEAQLELGLLYKNGVGVARDEARAKRWFDVAAADGVKATSKEFEALAKRKGGSAGRVADLDAQMAAMEIISDKALVEADFHSWLKFELDDVASYHRLTGNPDRMIATRLKALAANDAMLVDKHGTMENYFALLSSSCQWGRASLEAYKAQRPEAALYFAKVSVNKLQQARGYIDQLDRNLRECFLEVHRDRYRWLADLLMEMGRFPEAEQVLAMLKDFEFSEFTEATRSGTGSGGGAAMTTTAAETSIGTKYTGLSDELVKALKTSAQLRSKGRTGRTAEETQAFREAELVIERAQTSYREQFSMLANEVASLDAEAAARRADRERAGNQEALAWKTQANDSIMGTLAGSGFPAGTAAIHAVVTPKRIHWLLSTAEIQRAIPIEVPLEKVQKQIGLFREALTSRDPAIKTRAAELYRMIFAPVDAELQKLGVSNLLISLDGGLRYVPFAALNDGKDWLARRYAFSSFSDTQELRANAVAPASWEIAAFGVTKPSQTPIGGRFGPLPAVAAELEAIAGPGKGVAPGTIQLDEEFGPDALKDALRERVPLIHIATHFKLAQKEDESVLLLGNNQELKLDTFGKEGGYKFTGVDLLALSACQTAVPKQADPKDGSEFNGMGQVAQKAGAASVLASLWQVDDGSTASLMHQFYKNKIGGGMSKIEALRQVQVAFLDGKISRKSPATDVRAPAVEREGSPAAAATDWDHPFYWAPFVLMGNVI